MRSRMIGLIVLIGLAGGVGCHDNTPPPPVVPVPSSDDPGALREQEEIKPLPQPAQVEQRNY